LTTASPHDLDIAKRHPTNTKRFHDCFFGCKSSGQGSDAAATLGPLDVGVHAPPHSGLVAGQHAPQPWNLDDVNADLHGSSIWALPAHRSSSIAHLSKQHDVSHLLCEAHK